MTSSTWEELSTPAPNPIRLKAPLVEAPVAQALPTSGANEQENRVLQSLEAGPRHVDNIALEAGLGTPQALGALTMLEIKRLVRRLPGGIYELAE